MNPRILPAYALALLTVTFALVPLGSATGESPPDPRCAIDAPLRESDCDVPLRDPFEAAIHYSGYACWNGVIRSYCDILDPPTHSPPRIGPSHTRWPPPIPLLVGLPHAMVTAQYELPRLRASTLLMDARTTFETGDVGAASLGRIQLDIGVSPLPGATSEPTYVGTNGWMYLSADGPDLGYPGTLPRRAWEGAHAFLDAFVAPDPA